MLFSGCDEPTNRFQAIRQYSPTMMGEGSDQLSVATGLWMNTHTLYYKAAATQPGLEPGSEQTAPTKSSTSKSERKERKTKIDEHIWIGLFLILFCWAKIFYKNLLTFVSVSLSCGVSGV